MKRLSILALATIVFAIGCKKSGSSSDNNGGGGTTPTPVVTTTATTFAVPLVAAAETPAIAGTESAVAGTATITLNLTKTDGTATAANVVFTVSMNGFPAGSSITKAHIHQGAAQVAGSILVDTGIGSGDAPLTAGAGSFTKTVTVAPDLAQSFINNPAGFYFNVHSALNPNGVMRGQLNGVTGAPAASTPGTGGGGDTTPDPGTGGGGGYVDPTVGY